MLARIKAAIQVILLLDRLLPVAGIAGLAGGAYWFWASLSAMRPELLVPLVLGVMASVVLLINGVRAFLRNRSESLVRRSLRIYAIAESFSLMDAARILARSHDNNVITPYFRTLKTLADEGKVQVDNRNDQGAAWQWSRISRAELIRIAPEFGRNDPFA